MCVYRNLRDLNGGHTLAAVLRAEVDLDELPDETPARLRRVLGACLQRDPKQRVHDVADVRLAMEGVFETTVGASSEPNVAPQPQVWQRPVPLVLAGLALLAVGGLSVWTLTRLAPPPPGLVTRFPIPLAADQAFSTPVRSLVAVSPDGSQVVYVANQSLWLRPVDQLQAVQVRGTEERAIGPFFSADGQSIGFWASDQLKKVSVSGGGQ